MADKLTLETLRSAVAGSAAAFRCRTTLQPAGGEGDKVFPPTYQGAVYATEKRRLPGRAEPVECVLLDSVQSQANRMEEALQAAVDAGRLNIPVIEVDFSGLELLDEVGRITSLQAPHRIADAILRDSLVSDGNEKDQQFSKSSFADRWGKANLQNATPLYELCPTALIFGVWGSPDSPGGRGAKFQRVIVSEIVGIDAAYGVKTSSRIDPLQIRKQVKVIKSENGTWSIAPDSKAKGTLAPAEINHGNIPPDISAGGVTIASAEHMVVLSLPALRRLGFPIGTSASDRDKQRQVNIAGRTVLAALGLCGAALAAENGFDLRSRCLLWPTDPMKWELLDKPGEAPTQVEVSASTAIALLKEAIAEAEKVGLTWRTQPLVLRPAPQLADLVRKSQELAAAQGPGAEGEE